MENEPDQIDNQIENYNNNKRDPLIIAGVIMAILLVIIALALYFFSERNHKKDIQNNTNTNFNSNTNSDSNTNTNSTDSNRNLNSNNISAQNSSNLNDSNQSQDESNTPYIVSLNILTADSEIMKIANSYASKWKKDAMLSMLNFGAIYDLNGKIDPDSYVFDFRFISKSNPKQSMNVVLDQSGNLSDADFEGDKLIENPHVYDVPTELAGFVGYIKLSDIKLDLPDSLAMGEENTLQNNPSYSSQDIGGCINVLTYVKEKNKYFWSYTAYLGDTEAAINHVFLDAVTGKATQR